MSKATDPVADIKVSRPAHRALAAAGIVTFADLRKWTRAEIGALHGVGPKTFDFLEPAMRERGVTFRT